MRPVGSGHLEVAGYVRGTREEVEAGIRADLEARLTKSLGLFGTGTVGVASGPAGFTTVYNALFGVRARW